MSANIIKRQAESKDTASIASSDDPDSNFRQAIRYGNKSEVSRALFYEFLTDSSIQGVKFFCERKRHWSERVFWMIAFVIATYLSCIMIRDAWIKWEESPVIVSFSEKSTPIWKIPFPAVTICPETKSSTDKLNFTDVFNLIVDNGGSTANMSDEMINRMGAATHICDPFIVKSLNIGTNHTDNSIFETLNDIALSSENTTFLCKWRTEFNLCSKFMETTITEAGVCFTFNSLNYRDIYTEEVASELISVTENPNATHWNMEEGYKHSETNGKFLETYPYRVFGTGPPAGLAVLLRLNTNDLDYKCLGPVQGFKVILHSPGEIPQLTKNYFRVPLDQEVLVSIKPNMILTSKGLRDYHPSRKQCFFNSERQLKFFKVYTQRNCELECLSNFTKQECGCVKFSYPRTEDTPICGAAKVNCYNEAVNKLLEKVFLEGLGDTNTVRTECNCLPSCTSITYDSEISQAKFDWEKYFIASRASLDDFPNSTFARLIIYFKESEFITSKRSELYGLTDFLANCGGLLGLFIGVTALSFVEIFYYCTLRLFWTLRTYRSKRSSNNIEDPTNQHHKAYDNPIMMENNRKAEN